MRVSGRWAMLRLLPRVSPGLTLALGATLILMALLSTGFMLATGALVAAIPGAVAGGSSSAAGRRAIVALGVAAFLFLLEHVLVPFRMLFAQKLGRRLDLHLREEVMRATLQPVGISHLEDPATLDDISLARGVGVGEFTPAQAVVGLAGILAMYLQGFGAAVLIARVWWWLAVALVAANLLVKYRFRGELVQIVEVMIGGARTLRRTTYYRDLALTPGMAKEVRIFGLRRFVSERFSTHWIEAMRDVWRRRKKSRGPIMLMVGVIALMHAVAFAVIGWSAARGHIGIGMIAVLVQAVMATEAFGNISDDDVMVENGVAGIPAALALAEKIAPAHTVRAALRAPDGKPEREIRFEGVRFRYPGQERDVYDRLDLVIPAGRSLAIVGANGAGKTTLVKLLARLYEPNAGTITVDDVDVREFDACAWQRRIAAIFQDFVQYHLPARDNIGFGAIECNDDRELIEAVARRASAADVIEALPNRWDTILSRQFTGGADLSGGQWQRIALARALFAVAGGAGVLVLDEPTANLDVRAEVELFDRFLELTQGLTTILISHRFSTVRRADRIVVLDEGRVVEDGTHEELLALGGRYAEMFSLQAARFAEEIDV